jgi:hypothetical protein
MFPSPTQIKTSTTTPLVLNPVSADFPFIPAPSSLVTHQRPVYNTLALSPHRPTERSPASLSKPLLSLPLARKINYLISVSRQIESLARGEFVESVQQEDVERCMSVLEQKYDELRQEVECELESAWVNAGLFPTDMPTFPASSKVPGTTSVRPNLPTLSIFTPKTELKRKRELQSHYNSVTYPAYKKPKNNARPTPIPIQTHNESDRSYEDDPGVAYAKPASPMGVRNCMVPLTAGERKKMVEFEWMGVRGGRVGIRSGKILEEGCVSPRGGVYQLL